MPASQYGSGHAAKTANTDASATAAAAAATDQRTISVRAGIDSDTGQGAVVPPIHLSSNFSFAGIGEKRHYDYTRSGNPTRQILAEALAQLEHGSGAVVTASGMAAVTLVLQLVPLGGSIVCAHDCYGGTWRLLNSLSQRGLFSLHLVDLTSADCATAIRSIRPTMVWIETPSNPLLRITDIRAVCRIAHEVGAICVADNTFLSPVLQNPLTLGADIVIHSTTKYINGHSDVVGGTVVAKDAGIVEQLEYWANCMGLPGAPFDSYLTLRGLRTLYPRMTLHQANAKAIAELLEAHPAVSVVHYPGLASHPGHALAATQQKGFGAMLSFELKGGLEAVRKLTGSLRHFTLAESLGGVESLIAHPPTMTHASMDPETRKAAGITDGLLRVSVGIEDSADLCSDLEAALGSLAWQFIHEDTA